MSGLGALHRWRGVPEADRARGIWAGGAGPTFRPATFGGDGRVRAGFWCPCLGLGGAESWQLAMARSVDPRRVAWAGAAVIEGDRAIDPKMADQLAPILPIGRGLDAARSLAAASDVIVSWAVVDVAALLDGLDPKPRVVMACHFPGEAAWGPGTRAMLGGVDRFVAVSELALEAIPADLRPGAGVIWNAVDADRLRVGRDRATVRDGWGIPREAPVVGYLGRLAPEKDPAAMVRLAAALPDPWRVVLVGEGRERPALGAMAARVAPGRVALVGGDPRAGDVLNAFDALVVPSRYESFGLTLAEGLAAGVPTLATPTGLARLAPGLAREVPIGADGPELAAALLRDRDDRPGTAARVARARRFAADRLSIGRFGRDWTDLILEIAQFPGEIAR